MTTAEQLAHDQWLGALVMQVLVGVVVPLIVFGVMCAAFWILLTRAQRAQNQFDISQIFIDDATGKVSMTQILKGGGFVFHTVATIIVIATVPADALGVTIAYGGTWGPTAIGLEFVKRRWPSALAEKSG